MPLGTFSDMVRDILARRRERKSRQNPYTPPHDWDHPELSPEVCDMCLVNACGLCDEGDCCCSHGAVWPAESPWAALWAFGPGAAGYVSWMVE